MEYLVMAIIEAVGAFLPGLVDYFEDKYYSKHKDINDNDVYNMLDKILTSSASLSAAKVNEMLSRIQSAINAYYPGGSDKFIKYVNEAKRELQDASSRLTAKSIEQEVYTNAANNLSQIYENMSKKNKAGTSGKAILKQVNENAQKAAQAAKDLGIVVNQDELSKLKDLAERPVDYDYNKNAVYGSNMSK